VCRVCCACWATEVHKLSMMWTKFWVLCKTTRAHIYLWLITTFLYCFHGFIRLVLLHMTSQRCFFSLHSNGVIQLICSAKDVSFVICQLRCTTQAIMYLVVLCDTHDTTILIVDTSCRYHRYLRDDTTAIYRSSKKYCKTAQVSYRDTVHYSSYHSAECTQQACDSKTKLIKSQ